MRLLSIQPYLSPWHKPEHQLRLSLSMRTKFLNLIWPHTCGARSGTALHSMESVLKDTDAPSTWRRACAWSCSPNLKALPCLKTSPLPEATPCAWKACPVPKDKPLTWSHTPSMKTCPMPEVRSHACRLAPWLKASPAWRLAPCLKARPMPEGLGMPSAWGHAQ